MAQKRLSGEFKAKVALEAIQGDKTIARLASPYGVPATPIHHWKKQAQLHLVDAFERGDGRLSAQTMEAQEDRLYRPIGQLPVEAGWRRKKSKTPGPLRATSAP